MCNSTSTALHHETNKTSSTDFFSPSILQDQHQLQQTHLLTSNISNHRDKFYLLQIIAHHQHPEAVAPLSPPTHLETVENNVLCLFPFQNFSDLVNTRPQKVVQKLTNVFSQIRVCQLAPALNGLTNWNNRTMDTIALPWKVQTEIPTQSSSVSSHLKIVLGTLCTRWTSTCLGLTTRSENSVIANKLQTRWSTFGSKNHIAGLKCDQLVDACEGKAKIKEFWFKLWHALDKWKTEANSRSSRIYAAHELPAPRIPPQTVESHLQDHIFQKIQKMTSTIRREDLRPWQTAINTLTVMFSQWPNWRKIIDMILAYKFTNHQQEEKHILICYYKWTEEPVLVNSQGHEIRSKNYCWGHATDPSSALQIALAGGIRPASTVDENNAVYHWCPSFYCRIDGSLTHASITKDRYVQQSINTIIHTRRYSQMNHRPFIFHGIGKSRQQTHYKVVQGGVGGEYTASLFFDIIHGHDRRWLVRSHLAATMGFAV